MQSTSKYFVLRAAANPYRTLCELEHAGPFGVLCELEQGSPSLIV